MKKLLLILFFITTACIAATLFFYYSLVVHESNSVCEENFVIKKPYFEVVQSLAAKEPLEKIIESNNAKLKNKQWQKFIISRPRRLLNLKEYELEGLLDFNVEKNDKSLGDIILRFQQKVNVKKDEFNIQTYLREPHNNIICYNKIIKIIPINEFETQVNFESEVKVKKKIPYFFDKNMDEIVEKMNRDDLLNLKNNIINASEHPGLIIELKKKNKL